MGPETAAIVVGALVDVVADASRRGTTGDGTLEAVGQRWGAEEQSAAGVVTQLSLLRDLLAEELRADRRAVDRAVDQVVAAAVTALVARVERLSRTDALTGIGNRRAFEEAVRASAAVAARQGHPLTMVVADLDGLKQINDRYGHDAGDAAITGLARAFVSVLRTTDTMFRVGGDEFVLLLPFTEPSQVQRLMDRVTEVGAPAFTWGAASLADHGGDVAALFGEADVDMYRRRRFLRSDEPALLAYAPMAAALAEGTAEHGHGGTPWRWAWVAAAAVVLAAGLANVFAPTTVSSPPARLAAPRSSLAPVRGQRAGVPAAQSPGGSPYRSGPAAPPAAGVGVGARGSPASDQLIAAVTPTPSGTGSTSGTPVAGSAPPSDQPPAPAPTSSSSPGGAAPPTTQPSSASGSGPVGSLVSAVGSILRPLPVVGDLITSGPDGSTEVAGLVDLSGSNDGSTTSTTSTASTASRGLLGEILSPLTGS